MLDFAAVVVAVAFLVLVGYLVPTVIQLRRTVAQSERLLAQVNNELPRLFKDLKGTSENIHALTTQAKDCLLYTSPSPRDATLSRMPSSA